MAKGKTFFVAGIYGVGKSTLCYNIAHILRIPGYSASDLISAVNNEKYGKNKYVADKYDNQQILIEQVEQILLNEMKVLLAGHFCILNIHNEIEELPNEVFYHLNIDKILLLEAAIPTIINNLFKRDNKEYSHNLIESFMQHEHAIAQKIALAINKPLLIHQMEFNDSDLKSALAFFKN